MKNRPIAPTPTVQSDAAIDNPGLLRPADAAEWLGVSVTQLEQWRGAGKGPVFIKLSHKTIRYRAADLNAYVAARVQTSTAG